MSPATRDYLDSIEAGSFRLWNAFQSQIQPAASQKPTTASEVESGNPTSQAKAAPAQRDCPEGASPWCKPAVGEWSELHGRLSKDAAAATGSGTGCHSALTRLTHF